MGLEAATSSMQTAISQGQVNASATGPGSSPPSSAQAPTFNNQSSNGQAGNRQGSQPDPVTGQQTDASRAAADQSAVEDLLDLDAVPKFKYQGKEYTHEEFQKTQMFEKDYRKKTAEIAKEQKYSVNLKADLAKVKRDPTLAEEFRSKYPEKYHDYLDLVLEQAEREEARDNSNSRNQSTDDEVSPAVAKRLADMQKKLDKYESRFKESDEKDHAAKVSGIQQKLDQLFSGFEKKYDLAVEDAVLAKAEVLLAKNPEYKMTDAAWERLWKENHALNEAKYQKRYEARVKEQLAKNQEGGDIGRGGGTPSTGRKRFKDLGEVSDHMIASLSKGPSTP